LQLQSFSPLTLPSFLTPAGLVLKIFLALLPILLTFMNKRAGMQSLAQIDYGVMVKYFIFQVGRPACVVAAMKDWPQQA